MVPNSTKVMKDKLERPQALHGAEQIAPFPLLVVDKAPLWTSYQSK